MISSTLVITLDDSTFLVFITNWIPRLFTNIGCGWFFRLIDFTLPSIDTNIKVAFKGVATNNKRYSQSYMPWKFWFINIWYDQRSIKHMNSLQLRKIIFQLELFKWPKILYWSDRCYGELFVRNKQTNKKTVLNFFVKYRNQSLVT